MSKEIPLVILSSLVLFVCANDMMLDREAVNVISRSDGFVLSGFLPYNLCVIHLPSPVMGADEAGEEQKIKENACNGKSVLYICRRAGRTHIRRNSFLSTGQAGLPRSWGGQ